MTSDLSKGRGSSLLALPAAVADLAIIALAIAVALIVRGGRWRWLLGGLAVIYAFGVVAAAEFSTLIGLLVAASVKREARFSVGSGAIQYRWRSNG